MMGLTNAPSGGGGGLEGYATGTVTKTSSGVTAYGNNANYIHDMVVSGLAGKPKIVMLSFNVSAFDYAKFVDSADGTHRVRGIQSGPIIYSDCVSATFAATSDGFEFHSTLALANGDYTATKPRLAIGSSTLTWEAWW